MLEAIVVAVSPLLLNAIMGLVKWLSDMQQHGQKGPKRFFLALFSLVGVIAYSAYTGNPIDPNQVSDLLLVAGESLLAFFAAHGTYSLFWKAR